MIVIGIDPDLHSTAFGVLVDGKPRMVGLATVPRSFTGRNAVILMSAALLEAPWPADPVDQIVVEVPQQYRGSRNRADPEDLINLAAVAGAAVGALRSNYPGAAFAMPAPMTWKGQVAKGAHHRRLCKSFGWDFSTDTKDRVYPAWPEDLLGWGALPRSAYHHVLDALGLAAWAFTTAAQRHVRGALSRRRSP